MMAARVISWQRRSRFREYSTTRLLSLGDRACLVVPGNELWQKLPGYGSNDGTAKLCFQSHGTPYSSSCERQGTTQDIDDTRCGTAGRWSSVKHCWADRFGRTAMRCFRFGTSCKTMLLDRTGRRKLPSEAIAPHRRVATAQLRLLKVHKQTAWNGGTLTTPDFAARFRHSEKRSACT